MPSFDLTFKSYSNSIGTISPDRDVLFAKVINNINTTFYANKISIIIGTTESVSLLIENIYGFNHHDNVTRGEILYNNNIREYRTWFKKVGYVQNMRFFNPSFRVIDMIYYSIKFHRSSNDCSFLDSINFKNYSFRQKYSKNLILEDKIDYIMKRLKIYDVKYIYCEYLTSSEVFYVNLTIELLKECELMIIHFIGVDFKNIQQVTSMFDLLREYSQKGHSVIIGYCGEIYKAIIDRIDYLAIFVKDMFINNLPVDEFQEFLISKSIYDSDDMEFCTFLNSLADKKSAFYAPENEEYKNMRIFYTDVKILNFMINTNFKDYDSEIEILSRLHLKRLDNSTFDSFMETVDMIIQKDNESITKNIDYSENSVNIIHSFYIFMTKITIIKNAWIKNVICLLFIVLFSFLISKIKPILFSIFREYLCGNLQFTTRENFIHSSYLKYVYGFFYINFFHFIVLKIFPSYKYSNHKKYSNLMLRKNISRRIHSHLSYILGNYIFYWIFYTLCTIILFILDSSIKDPILNFTLLYYIYIYLLGSFIILPVYVLIFLYLDDLRSVYSVSFSNLSFFVAVPHIIGFASVWYIPSISNFILKNIIILIILSLLYLPNFIVNAVFMTRVFLGDGNLFKLTWSNDDYVDKYTENISYIEKLFFRNTILNVMFSIVLIVLCLLWHVKIAIKLYKRRNKNNYRLKTSKRKLN